MFADEEMEQDGGSEQPADEEEVEQDDSSEQPAEEAEKSAGDAWTTAPDMKKVDKKAAAASSKAKKEPAKEDKADEDEGGAKAGRQPTASASATSEQEKAAPEPVAEAVPASADADSSSEKFPRSLLSSMGIEDPDTQKWVMIGAGVLIVLCCGCACLAAMVAAISNSGGF